MPPRQKSNHAFNNFPALVALPAKGAPSSSLATIVVVVISITLMMRIQTGIDWMRKV